MIDNSNSLNIDKIDNIEPKYWGKNGWIFLDSIALTYKPEMKDKYKIFFEQLPYILPCEKCGEKMLNSVEKLDDALVSKEALMNWLLDIRNEVYISQGRKKTTLISNINEIFESHKSNVIVVLYFVIIIILITIFYLTKTTF